MKKVLLGSAILAGVLLSPATAAFAVTPASPSHIALTQENATQETGVVVDRTGHLTQHNINQLNAVAKDMMDQYDVAMAVEFTDDYSGSIQNYAINRANELGLGDATKNNGLLFVINLNEREFFVATGDGISAIVSDSKVEDYNNTFLVPAFKNADYVKGISDVANMIGKTYHSVAGLTPEEREAQLAQEEKTRQAYAIANAKLQEIKLAEEKKKAEESAARWAEIGKVAGISTGVLAALGLGGGSAAVIVRNKRRKQEEAEQAAIALATKREKDSLQKFIENFEFSGKTLAFKAAENAQERLAILSMATSTPEEQLRKDHQYVDDYYSEIVKKLSQGISVTSSESINKAVEDWRIAEEKRIEAERKAEEERQRIEAERQANIQTSKTFWNDLPRAQRDEFRSLGSQNERQSWLNNHGFNSNLLYTFLMLNVLNMNNVGSNTSIVGHEREVERQAEAAREAARQREADAAAQRAAQSSFTSTSFGSGSSFGGGSFGGGGGGGAGGSW